MSLGFYILRHVSTLETNDYWIECYKRLREFYPDNEVIIIDDNSNYDSVSEIPLNNTTVIQSEYHGRG